MALPNTPTNTGELEKLVQRLYLPGSPQEISRIQSTLQSIQRSTRGWQFADALLGSLDDKVRFFGALTFTIKIKADWDSLSPDESSSLLDRLLLWLVRLVNSMEKPLVIRKICASLVAYFLRPGVTWEHCVRHLICCFSVGEVVPLQAVSQHPSTAELVINLSQLQLTTALWFSTNLVEEVGKTNIASIETYDYHNKVVSDLEDTVIILSNALNGARIQNIKVTEEAVKCFQSWVMYAQQAWIEKALELGPLRVLTPLALENLIIEGLFDVTAEFFIDILSHFPAFFTPSDYSSLSEILSSPLAQSHILTLKAGVFDIEPTMYAKLLFAYGDAAVQDLARNFDQSNSVQILRHLVDLLGCDAYAGADDEVCSQCLEFWTTFTEFLVDSTFAAGDEVPFWMESAKNYIPEVIQACWTKIRMPPAEVFSSWDPAARDAFKEIRSDVTDLLQSSYTLLGLAIFDEFARLAIESLANHAWLHLEATLFCLNALSDCITDEFVVDKALSMIFGSSLFAAMMGSTTIPATCRQTAVSLITNYTAFFERRSEYLPSMLNFLFESLKMPAISNVAAKAIHASCWACRKALISELGAFLHQYEILLTWKDVEASTKEKVIGAIAAIVQAIPLEEERLYYVDNLLMFVERDIQAFMTLLREGRDEESQAYGICALRCLASMGKALQVPDEISIDLEAKTLPSSLWVQGTRTSSTQAKIVRLMEVVTKSRSNDSHVMEAACQILRTGYKESAPGPFVFPPSVTETLVLSSELATARLDYILDTAGALLTRHTSTQVGEISNAALAFLVHILRLISAMDGDPTFDPEVASSCIDLAEKYIPSYLRIFLDSRTQFELPVLLTFSLRCLTAAEVMPKRSAAYFWASLVQTYELPEEMLGTIQSVMHEYGPQLSFALVMNIGGLAARSDLDILAEPLKKMVHSQAKAKEWLSAALASEAFPSQKVTAAEKRIWLQKVINLRGGKGTNQLVKDFWMSCRGTNLSFG